MRIVNFGQVVDLENGGGFAHQFTVLLPNGDRVGIVTNEETVGQLIQLATGVYDGQGSLPVAPQQAHPGSNGTSGDQAWSTDYPQHVEDPEEEDEPEGVEFGGDYDPGELSSEAVMGVVSERPVQLPVAVQGGLGGLGQTQPPAPQQPHPSRLVDSDGFARPVPSRTVQADEAGYPVVQQRVPAGPRVMESDDDDGTQV
jgi:hypothetical protein